MMRSGTQGGDHLMADGSTRTEHPPRNKPEEIGE